MKITLRVSDILDSVYANSALNAMALEAPGSLVAFVLSPVHADALQRVARSAFATAIAFVGGTWQISSIADDEFVAECSDNLAAQSTTLAEQLSVAVAELIVYMIFAAAGTPQAAASHSLAKTILQNLNRPAATLPRLSPD